MRFLSRCRMLQIFMSAKSAQYVEILRPGRKQMSKSREVDTQSLDGRKFVMLTERHAQIARVITSSRDNDIRAAVGSGRMDRVI